MPRFTRPLITAPRLVGALSLVLATGAATQEAGAAGDLAKAKKRFREGERLHKAKHYEEAALAFERAYALSPKPELLHYVAQSWEQAGELVRAQESYQRYNDEFPDAENADAILDKIIDLQERITSEMARLKVTTPQEARDVFVDAEDAPRCQTPCQLVLKPGAHVVRVSGPEEATFTREVTLQAGDREELAAHFQAHLLGQLRVVSDVPNAQLKLAGRTLALPMSSPHEIEAGDHDAALFVQGEPRWRGPVTVAPHKETSLIIPLAHTGSSQSAGLDLKRAGAYTLISAGAGLLVGGALMGLQARRTHANLDDLRSAGQRPGDALIDQGRTQQRAANILFASSALGLTGGAGLLTWSLMKSREAAAPPSQTPSGGGGQDAAPAQPGEVELLD